MKTCENKWLQKKYHLESQRFQKRFIGLKCRTGAILDKANTTIETELCDYKIFSIKCM